MLPIAFIRLTLPCYKKQILHRKKIPIPLINIKIFLKSLENKI